MKTSVKLLAAATLATSAPTLLADVHGDPYRPVGSLDLDQHMVRNGKKAEFSWGITYPVTVPDLIIPQAGGTVLTKEELRVKIRVVGVAHFNKSNNGHGNNDDGVDSSNPGASKDGEDSDPTVDDEIPVGFWTKIGNGSWSQAFYGNGTQVAADEYVFEQIVPANTTIDFAGRGRKTTGSWFDIRWTMDTDSAVVALQNGDSLPNYSPALEQGAIESFLSSYINDDNLVTMGPRDMIYLFELASRSPGESSFDLQDLAVVVTYEQTNTAP